MLFSMKTYGNHRLLFLWCYNLAISLFQAHEYLKHFKQDEIDNHLGKLYIEGTEFKSLHLTPKSISTKIMVGQGNETSLHQKNCLR